MTRFLVAVVLCWTAAACGSEDSKCEPQCDGKQCGDDGCGGTCGACAAGTACSVDQCVPCEASCLGHMCGPDGCGGDCGACGEGQVCDALSLLCIDKPAGCQPQCEANLFECGPDGCGSDCGICGEGTFCKPDLRNCVGTCTPQCDGLECGADGCGGQCGTCLDTEICDQGKCVSTAVLPEDDFKVLYSDKGRIPGVNDNENDIYLVNTDGTNPLVPGTAGPQALTAFSLGNATDCQLILAEDQQGNPTEYGPCSCNFGCVVDRALKWIAVSLKKPTATGFTFQIGRFDAQLHVAMVKGVYLKNIIDFKFAGNYLYYTKQYACDGLHCQYMFYRVQLEPVGQTEELFVFPPTSDPDWPKHSNYKGHFKASKDGSVLVILGTTIRSNRIYMWKAGNLHELDYICNQFVNGECIGAGSEYTDTDPVAISPDNSRILAFTIAESDLRVRLYDTETLQQKYLNLFSVPAGAYLAGSCPVVTAEGWKFRKVVGDPVFSPDGKSVFFLSYTDCQVVSADSKPLTNVLMMDLAAIGDGTPFEESDFVNVTHNPNLNTPDNTVIDSFDVSPSGKTVVLTASPRFKFVGNDPLNPIYQPLDANSERAQKDREVWLIGAGGTGKTQLTDNNKYSAQSPMALDASVTSFYNGQ